MVSRAEIVVAGGRDGASMGKTQRVVNAMWKKNHTPQHTAAIGVWRWLRTDLLRNRNNQPADGRRPPAAPSPFAEAVGASL